jgi:hypothetical protein
MDNKLNEIRRKISRLRAEMLALQEDIRALVNDDQDCSEPSFRLLAMRAEMVEMIVQRNAMGGGEVCPNIAERLREDHRPLSQRRGRGTAPAKKNPAEAGSSRSGRAKRSA